MSISSDGVFIAIALPTDGMSGSLVPRNPTKPQGAWSPECSGENEDDEIRACLAKGLAIRGSTKVTETHKYFDY